jgi:hypothetical protein
MCGSLLFQKRFLPWSLFLFRVDWHIAFYRHHLSFYAASMKEKWSPGIAAAWKVLPVCLGMIFAPL